MRPARRSPSTIRRIRPRLRIVDEPLSGHARMRREKRPRPFGNPLSRGALALSGSVAAFGLALWLLVSGRWGTAGLGALILATAFATLYLALVGQAVKRGKVVEYWEDRRELRWELSRKEAYVRLLTEMMEWNARLREHSEADVEEAFQAIVDSTYSVFAPAYDDLAVLIAYQAGEDCQVVRSKLGPGSRWHDLRSGKRCTLKGNLEQRLRELAPYHYSQQVSTYFEPLGAHPQSITSWPGTLWLIVLQDSELASDEKALIRPLLPHLGRIASHWSPARLGEDPGRLHAIG